MPEEVPGMVSVAAAIIMPGEVPGMVFVAASDRLFVASFLF